MNWKFIRIIDAWLGIPIIFGIFIARRLFGQQQPQRPDTVRRMLLIKFWGIGNLFMMLPSVQALRTAYPDVAIDFLSLDSNRDAIRACGVFDDFVTISTDSPRRFLVSWWQSITLLRRNNYDIIIDFEQFARFSALVATQIGAAEIIGFDTRGQFRSCFFTHAVPYDNTVHITRSFLALASAAEAGAGASFPPIRPASLHDLRRRGAELLGRMNVGPEELCVVMHVGTSENSRDRRWLPERYAALADLLAENYRARIVFTGLAEESFLAGDALGHMRKKDSAADLSGQLNFADYFALITVADLVISADTAPVHLASAVDTPVVGLYGPNTPLLYGPWGSNGSAVYAGFDCSPCITNFNAKLHTCRHADGQGACMRAIQAADVYAVIQQRYLSPAASCRLEKLAGG